MSTIKGKQPYDDNKTSLPNLNERRELCNDANKEVKHDDTLLVNYKVSPQAAFIQVQVQVR